MKIKACPFCARKPEVIKLSNNKYTVVCWCGAESPNDSINEQGAIRIWGRRRLTVLESPTLNKQSASICDDCKYKRGYDRIINMED